jgi:glycogen debranching enzyme
MISFDEGICRNLDTSSQREWLETNGLGGFASSTIAGLHTRRYHGLLVAATKPGDLQYRGKYGGDLASRDGSYHQGTVWPWLLGPFIRAYLRVNGGSRAAKDRAVGWIVELRRYFEKEGVGQIPEIFEGDAPHRAAGCLAQAWSVAELLRVWVEDLHAPARPKPKRSRAAAR